MDFQCLDVGNLRISYLDTGSADNPIVLLIHGLGGSIESWTNNINPISKRQFRVIVVDLPCFGFSDKPKINYTISFYTIFIEKFLKTLKVSSSVSIVGCSMGGHITAEVAINYPDLVSKLVLISPAGALPVSFKGTPALRNYISVLKANSMQEVKKALLSADDVPVDDTFAQTFYDKLSMPGAKEAFMSALRGSTYAPRLNRNRGLHTIKAHTLLMWGNNDKIIPVRFIKPFINMENFLYCCSLSVHSTIQKKESRINCYCRSC